MVESKHQWKAWLYLSPAIVLLLVFTVWPIFNTVRMAFLNGYSPLQAVNGAHFEFGVQNFAKVIQYKKFLQCLKNTALLCVTTVPLSTILALLIAVALNSIKPLRRTLQTIFFLPYVTNSIAIGMVFAAMFNIIGLRSNGVTADSLGIVNNVLMGLGLDDLNIWFTEWITNVFHLCGAEPWPWLIKFLASICPPINWINSGSGYGANITVMIVYIVWNALPFKILILLGGLQSINKQYYDAARVDSTPRSRVLTRITVPLLSPMIAYVVITGFIGGFKEYSSIVGIFGEKMGPAGDAGRLNTMVGFIYDAMSSNNLGRASAAALILFGIILVVTLINGWVSKKRVHF